MGWLSQNWLWVLFGIAFVGMHLIGHGGHGGHDAGGDEHREHAQGAEAERHPRAAGNAASRVGHDAMRGALNTKLVTWALGSFAALTFIVCVIYGLVTPPSLHMQEFLEQVLPAFKWLTWLGFLLGLAESFLYGAYAGLVFCPIYNLFDRNWGPTASRSK